MSALLKALIIGRLCACSLVQYWFLDFFDLRSGTKFRELFKLMLAYLLMETTYVNTPSFLEVWNQLFVISYSSSSSTSEGKANLDPIL